MSFLKLYETQGGGMPRMLVAAESGAGAMKVCAGLAPLATWMVRPLSFVETDGLWGPPEGFARESKVRLDGRVTTLGQILDEINGRAA